MDRLTQKFSSLKSDDYFSDLYIPDALLRDILSRLPAKSLMRFRCVCTSWYSLITYDREFHKLHLLNFNSNSNGLRWFGYQLLEEGSFCNTIVWLYDEAFASHQIQADHLNTVQNPSIDFYYSKIIGSCNGIVCLYLPLDNKSLEIPEEWGFERFKICLWNPSIRKYSMFDSPWKDGDDYRFNDYMLTGFGLSISNEYKFVIILTEEEDMAHVYVYSLNTNSWSEIKAKPDEWMCGSDKDYGTYYNGSCHWIRPNIKHGGVDMMCFNLEDHTFSGFDLPPKSEFSPSYDCFKIVIRKDELCVWETIEECEGFAVNIWAMKEYGNCGSWSNIQRVHIKEDYRLQYLFGFDARGRLLFKLFKDVSYLRACDSKNEEIQVFESCETCDIWDMAPYRESLALL